MKHKKYFSERHGYKPSKVTIQLESMDNDLRVALWNAMFETFWGGFEHVKILRIDYRKDFLQAIWTKYFKQTVDTFPNLWGQFEDYAKEYLFSLEWHQVYDFIEFMMDHWTNKHSLRQFYIPISNDALEREFSGYRIIEGVITPITDEIEISEIEGALKSRDSIRPVRIQFENYLAEMIQTIVVR